MPWPVPGREHVLLSGFPCFELRTGAELATPGRRATEAAMSPLMRSRSGRASCGLTEAYYASVTKSCLFRASVPLLRGPEGVRPAVSRSDCCVRTHWMLIPILNPDARCNDHPDDGR